MKKTKELINLDYVKENIDLKKFIKILDKKKSHLKRWPLNFFLEKSGITFSCIG